MTKVKICGLTEPLHIEAAVNAGADYLGFVFAKSRRQIEPAEARKMTEQVPKTVGKVGVFVSPSFEEVQTAIQAAQLTAIQLHGKLKPSLETAIQTGVFAHQKIAVIQAFDGEADTLEQAFISSNSDFGLLDAPVRNHLYAGGNGQSFDWQKAAKKSLPFSERFFIAGGLHVANVQQAIAIFDPYAVDISSGVETNGKKDSKKIQQFIHLVKEKKR
ncbi:phosphoribosylanthranilate isomerase [Enterococcus sp.]|uniref:phosphoribosylanthranilate isomerase n=1 Tax=Enterococcus sp. TaxID=35783 RepID=UPI0025C30C50|nr:phosphoribosylanthranilate isomerase [Enterococcus sp.]